MYEETHFLSDVRAEVERARAKFPNQLRQKLVSLDGEGHKGITERDLYKECVQLAVMAMRIAIDNPKWGHSPGSD